MQDEVKNMTFKIFEGVVILLATCLVSLMRKSDLTSKTLKMKDITAISTLKILKSFNICFSSIVVLILNFLIYFYKLLITLNLQKKSNHNLSLVIIICLEILNFIIQYLNIGNYLGFTNPGVFIFIDLFFSKPLKPIIFLASKPRLAFFLLLYFEVTCWYQVATLIKFILSTACEALLSLTNSTISKLITPLFDLIIALDTFEDTIDDTISTTLQNQFERATFDALTNNFTKKFINATNNINYGFIC